MEISDGGLGGARVASGGGLMLKVEQQQSTNLFFFSGTTPKLGDGLQTSVFHRQPALVLEFTVCSQG